MLAAISDGGMTCPPLPVHAGEIQCRGLGAESRRSTPRAARSSGKMLEIPVKNVLLAMAPEEAASKDTLGNPDSLQAFVGLS